MKKKRILLVDDEVPFTRLFKLNLEQAADYEVRVENWPERAVAAAREFEPDLVLLDFIMPCLIGSDVATRLRQDAKLKVPIVFLSAAGAKNCSELEMRPLNEFPYIAKPVSMEELINGIERHLPRDANPIATGSWPMPVGRPQPAITLT